MDNASTVTLDQTSVGRLSRLDAMQQQAMAQASLLRLDVQRRRVEAALDRIRHGSYGTCCACESDIGLERLLTDPATPFCMDCQAERDTERHGMR
ncbi:MAG TPA: TraR/DksA C4-type zinc finger protein [Pseudorhodoferax sp.]|nr:TraR/DksA C4-type zinc finger protein [Pseudorhodoferax sp.]